MGKIDVIFRSYLSRIWKRFPKILSDEFLRDTNVRVIMVISGVLIAATWLVSFFRFTPSDFMVPIRYNSFLGVTTLGSWYDLYFVPGAATLFMLLNSLLGNVVYKKDKMIGYILVAGNIFVAGMALLVVVNFSRLVNI